MAIYNCTQCGAILPYAGAYCSSCAQKRVNEQRWRNQSSSLSSYVSNGSSSTSNRSSSHSSSCSYEKVIDKLSETITKLDKVLSFTGYKKQSFSDGSCYEGDFVNGKFHGKGKYTWANGNVYVGDWVEDCRHGKGTLRWKDGDVYVGDWVKNERTGKGKYTYADGDCYEGYFVNGESNGYGKYIYADGAVYEGEFKNNMAHGKGKMTDADGETYEGEFKEGERHGKGVLTAPDGTAVEYYYENDKIVCKAAEATDEIITRIYGTTPPKTTAKPRAEKKTTATVEVRKTETAVPVAKVVEESLEESSEQKIWNSLLKMSEKEKKAYFETHHELTVPVGTEVIPAKAFEFCLGLKKINFNDDIREIGEYAFYCTGIDSVLMIPKSVSKIRDHAFAMCHVEKIILPNNITVEEYAFAYIKALSEVIFETDLPQDVVFEKKYLHVLIST